MLSSPTLPNQRLRISSSSSFASLRSSRSPSISSSLYSWASVRSSGSNISNSSFAYSESTITSPVRTRALSTIESSRAFQNVIKTPTSIAIVAATYSGSVDRENLFPALSDVIFSEPMLGTNIFTSKKNLQLTKIDFFDLEEVVTFDTSGSLKDFLNSACDISPLPYDRKDLPLWRVFVFANNEIAFLFDRGCFDESSGVYFHKKLVNRMAFPNKHALPKDNWIVETSPLAIPDSIDSLLSIKPNKQSHIKGIFKMNKTKNVWCGPRSSKKGGSTLIFEIPAVFVRKLHSNVKHRGLSLTSTFYSALMQSVLESFPNHYHNNGELELQTSIPTNIRSLLRSKLNDDVLGNFSIDLNHSLGNFTSCIRPYVFEEKWAKSLNTYLSGSCSSLEALRRTSLLSPSIWNSGDDMKKRIQSMTSKPKENLIEINNLGLISLGRRRRNAEITIDKFTFLQPNATHNSSLGCGYSLNIVALENGPAVFTLSVAVDDKLQSEARRIRDSFLNVLSNLLET